MLRDISQERFTGGKPNLRRFHQARWDEPVIFELSQPGERGLLVPEVEEEIKQAVGDVLAELPEAMRRASPPALPEMGQPQVMRHYARLSQENLGVDLNPDIGQGTCTMKYSPKVNEQLARLPEAADLHPLQPEGTIQGFLEIMYRFEQILIEISGMDAFTFQPGAGSQAIYAAASIMRAYHAACGEGSRRDEIITTIFSHPSDAACPRTIGFKIITLYPDEDGYPDLEALKAALSERTAGLMITNPEDTGIFNPKIAEFVRLVHEAGGLAFYDQANANGILGITRAGDAGFDLCHFNLHKTFSTPHGSGGPGAGALGVRRELARFLPVPVVEREGDPSPAAEGRRYRLNYDLPESVGKIKQFYGNVQNVLRAYAWAMSLGADGLRQVAETAVLNNNYVLKRMRAIRGVSAPYARGKHRIEQVRYSWEELNRDTGVTTEELGLRAVDYGLHYWTSHHPFVVSQPLTIEPAESYSRADLDEYVDVLEQVAQEAYENPELVKTAPHNSAVHRSDAETGEAYDDPGQWAMTWRAYKRKLLAHREGWPRAGEEPPTARRSRLGRRH